MSNYSSNVIEVNIQYDANKAPDYKVISEKIDEHLKKHFKGQKIVVHPISGGEHPDRNIEDVLNHLLEHGTEKPVEKNKEPGKENVYDFLGNYHEIHDKSDIMSAYAKDNQMKVDLIAVYDSEHVEKIPYSDKSKGIGDAYKFKQPDNKKTALKGVLKIIHEKKDAEEKQAGTEQKTAIKQKPGAKPEQGEPTEEDIEQLAAELGLDYQGAN
jgi:hypothetical protein